MVFITRHNEIVPPVVKLSAEWGAAAFMLGESVETSAGDPSEAGKQRRVVGTNPFIVGSEEEKVICSSTSCEKILTGMLPVEYRQSGWSDWRAEDNRVRLGQDSGDDSQG
jgi:hypothetical protein